MTRMIKFPDVLLDEGRLERVLSILDTCESLGLAVEAHAFRYELRLTPFEAWEEHKELMQTIREWKWCLVCYLRFMCEVECG